MGYVIGVDIGGTFTDCVAIAADGAIHHAKTLSTHGTDPGEGILTGVDLLAEQIGCSPETLLAATDRVAHGTTIGTNLVVERKGARIGLIATVGHGDAIAMMRGNGRVAGLSFEAIFDLHNTDMPAPLVPRDRIIEVQERIDREGAIVCPLDEAEARAKIAEMLEEGVEAVAIALLWSFKNPAHEERLAAIVRELAPDVYVCLSSQVSPRIGEYERTVATVINAYIGPASTRYLRYTEDRLKQRGLAGPFLVMQADGGVLPIRPAERIPVSTLDSGPAGGLQGTALLARAAGHDNVLATDMGGTSFDVGLIIGGHAVTSERCVINQYSFNSPHLDCRSIACGGGSIAWVDPYSKSLRVGPHSAGSVPGPVCYGRGGTRPTVTDADVVLGLLRGDGFLSGKMALDVDAARRAIGDLGEALGLSVEETAAGILRVNNTAAASLIRQRTIEQGVDPRDFVIYSFGGAGPVHAFGYAPELGCDKVVIPLGNGASTLSAFGIASSDISRYFDLACDLPLPLDPAGVDAMLRTLEQQALRFIAEEGFDEKSVILERFGLFRYAEQYLQTLILPLPDGGDSDWNSTVEQLYNREYVRLYGSGALVLEQAVQLFTLRVKITVPLGLNLTTHVPPPREVARRAGVRPVFWPEAMRWIDTDVWDGHALGRDSFLEGPAVVELPHTTVAVGPGQRLRVDQSGSMVITMGQGQAPASAASLAMAGGIVG